ncbi:MAG: radical SAM protein [Elusimicrobiales bacterium]|nr:radical SAM protein [Elusimicrobiales bacterium]
MIENAKKPVLWCAVWELTLACNLGCLHCGASAGARRENELSPEEALRLADSLAEAGARGVALMGGEPFLRPDWADIARRIRGHGMALSIITNGTSAGARTVETLRELSPRAVAVSMDAAAPALHDEIRGKEGSWRTAWDFILACRAAGLPVSVITTVHKKNLGELGALRDMLLGKNIAWQIQTAGAEGARFPKDLLLSPEEFYSVGLFVGGLKKTYSTRELPVIGAHDLGYHSYLIPPLGLGEVWEGCQAGLSVMGIQSDGGVKGCLAMNEDYVEGNVREKSVKEIWESPDSFAYNRRFDMLELGENCLDCEFRFRCKGGCSEMSLMLSGKKHNDPYCFLAIEKKLFAAELARPWRRIYFWLRRFYNTKLGIKRDLLSRFSGKI